MKLDSAALSQLSPGRPTKVSCVDFTKGIWTTNCPTTSVKQQTAQLDSLTDTDSHRTSNDDSSAKPDTQPSQEIDDESQRPIQDPDDIIHQLTPPPSSKPADTKLTARHKKPADCDPTTFHQYDCGREDEEYAEQNPIPWWANFQLIGPPKTRTKKRDPGLVRPMAHVEKEGEDQVLPPILIAPLVPSTSSSSIVQDGSLPLHAPAEKAEYCDPESFQCGYPPRKRSEEKQEEHLGVVGKAGVVAQKFVA